VKANSPKTNRTDLKTKEVYFDRITLILLAKVPPFYSIRPCHQSLLQKSLNCLLPPQNMLQITGRLRILHSFVLSLIFLNKRNQRNLKGAFSRKVSDFIKRSGTFFLVKSEKNLEDLNSSINIFFLY